MADNSDLEPEEGTACLRDIVSNVIDVNGVPTHVLSIGCTLSQLQIASSQEFQVILVVPGNPGCIDFYRPFIRSLYDQSQGWSGRKI